MQKKDFESAKKVLEDAAIKTQAKLMSEPAVKDKPNIPTGQASMTANPNRDGSGMRGSM